MAGLYGGSSDVYEETDRTDLFVTNYSMENCAKRNMGCFDVYLLNKKCHLNPSRERQEAIFREEAREKLRQKKENL